jgi:hypothetical protein
VRAGVCGVRVECVQCACGVSTVCMCARVFFSMLGEPLLRLTHSPKYRRVIRVIRVLRYN